MRVLIADDEAPQRERLAEVLREAGCVVVSEHEDGESVSRWLASHPGQIDAMFLDIRMPRRSGLDLLGDHGIPTVLVTAWEDHAVTAFEMEAFDYLLKPISLDRVARTVKRLDERIQTEGDSETTALAQVREGRSGGGMLGLDEIDAFEVIDREVFAWAGKKRYLVMGLRTLKEIEKTFQVEAFQRLGANRLVRERPS